MLPGHLIYIRRCLLKNGSLYRATYLHRQARSGHFDRGVYPPAIGWSIELIFIDSIPDQDPTDDYPEIRESTCRDSIEEGRLIIMVAPARGPSHNSSSRYPTIGRSETSNAQTPNDEMICNLNSDFNIIRLQTIMESI
jgi:hypothetical protein